MVLFAKASSAKAEKRISAAIIMVIICPMMTFMKFFNWKTMKRFISAAVIVSMVVVSCTSKEDLGKNGGLLQQPSSDNVKVFSDEFAEPITKVSPSYEETDRTVTVLWDQDDKVGV